MTCFHDPLAYLINYDKYQWNSAITIKCSANCWSAGRKAANFPFQRQQSVIKTVVHGWTATDWRSLWSTYECEFLFWVSDCSSFEREKKTQEHNKKTTSVTEDSGIPSWRGNTLICRVIELSYFTEGRGQSATAAVLSVSKNTTER